jgi:hypothetical protein
MSLHSKVKFSAEDEDLFNSARLLLLFKVLDKMDVRKGINIERIGYFDFFSAQPFLIFREDDEDTRLDLIYYGFESKTISYGSSSQRFENRREKLKQYLAGLIVRDLITIENIDGELVYSITETGKIVADMFNNFYDAAYQKSAKLIIGKLKNMSNKKISANAREWLKAEPFVIDLYDF